jgi:hypothetical protein
MRLRRLNRSRSRYPEPVDERDGLISLTTPETETPENSSIIK